MKILIIPLFLVMWGCTTPVYTGVDPSVLIDKASSSSSDLTDIQKKVNSSCDAIDSEQVSQSVKNNTVVIRDSVGQLDSVKVVLGHTEELASQTIKIMEMNKKLVKAHESRQEFIWITLIAISASMIVVSVGLIAFNFTKIGISLFVTGVISTALSEAAMEYGWVLSLIGIIVIISVAIYAIYQSFINYKALSEVVHSVEAVSSSPMEGKSWKESKDVVNVIQSKVTKKMVKDIKDNKVLV